MKHFNNKGLSYYCNQKLDDLKEENGALHCTLCSKEIIDFRTKTKKEYSDIINRNDKICGIYHREQIHKEFPLSKLISNGLSIFTLFYFLLISTPSKSQNTTHKTEQTDSTKSNTVIPPTKEKQKGTEKKGDSSNCQRKNKYRHRKKLYFDRRFPFIHYGYNYVMGFRSPSNDWIKKR